MLYWERGACLVMLKAYPWLCAQEKIGGFYGMLGNEPQLTVVINV